MADRESTAVMPTSVMPKGVEHQSQCQRCRPAIDMPTSVMPKGVEHSLKKTVGKDETEDAHLCDAERR